MTRDFEYFTKVVVNASLSIEDIGECAIRANNDLGYFWFLVIQTELGLSEIFEVGPIMIDIDELPKACNWSYRRIQYSDTKLSKIIDNFLNDGYRCITQAEEITVEEAKENFRNLADYIK